VAVLIKVLLADEAELMRRAIRFVLGQDEGIRIVGEASSLEAAIQKATELDPHVMVLDLNMANRDGAPLTEVKSLLNGQKFWGSHLVARTIRRNWRTGLARPRCWTRWN
jgi:DNA-binding NarL/FixJ family response regulator